MEKIYHDVNRENVEETMIKAPEMTWKEYLLSIGKSSLKGAAKGALKEMLDLLNESNN